MKNVFFNDAKDRERVFELFQIEDDKAVKFIYTNVDDGWDSSAFILFKKGRVMYEINAGHCSCNGYEGQWEPEEVSWKDLAGRIGKYPPRLWNDEFVEYIKLKAKV